MSEQPTYEELERKLSELEIEVLHSKEDLRESEERYWVLFERSFDMVYIHDLEGRFMDASDIALDTLGYAREEIPDLTISSIICPEHMPLVTESIEDLMKTGIQKKTTEYKLRRKDGSFIWVETSASVIYRDGKPYAIQGIAHDITERKRAEDALRQNEERYRGILDNMEEGYFEEDLKGNFTFFNEAARRMMGYDRDEMLGLNYRRFTSPETARRMFEVYHRVYETGIPEHMVDYEVIRKDGSVRMHESSVVLLRDSLGQPVGFSELARDVTERRREEDILRKREERYRNILDSMEEAYFEVDLKGNLTFFNTTAVKRLGYTNEEVMGMSFHQFVDEENAKKVFEGYHKVFLTGEPIKGFDWELVTGTGERIAVESSVTLNRGEKGAPIGFKGIVRDISDRKKAEQALRESEEKYRTILERIEEAYSEIDLAGKFTFMNESLCRILGYSREELMGMNNRDFTTPEMAKRAFQMFNEIYKTGSQRTMVDYEIIRKDGTKRFIDLSASLMREPSGNPIGFRCVGRDVTERILAEQKVRESDRRYRMLAENVHDAIWTMDLDMQFTYVSPSSIRLTGFTPEEMLGMSLRQYLGPESFDLTELVLVEELTKGRSIEPFDPNRSRTVELEMLHKDGGTVWIEFMATFRRDIQGIPIEILGVARDISKRKKAEEALRESEKQYRLLAENARDVIWVLDLKLRHQYVSPSVMRLRGYTPEEAMKQTLDMFLTPESYQRVMDMVAKEFEFEKSGQKHGKEWARNIELEMICKDGSTVWTEVTVNLIFGDNGRLMGLLGITRDITDRKKAEVALKQSEGLYRTIFENTATSNIIVSEDTIIHLANTNFETMTGYSKSELEGKMSWTFFVVKEDLERMKRYHKMRRFEPGSAPSNYEFRYTNRNGEVRDLYMSVAVIPGTKDSVASMIDITERNRAEEALREREAKYRFLTEKMNDIVWTMDLNLHITYVSPSITKVLGYSPEERMGQALEDQMTPESIAEATRILAYELEREGIEGIDPDRMVAFEAEYYHKDGSRVWLENMISGIRDDKGKVVGLHGVSRDVTERRKTGEALRESEERFRDLANLLPETVFETDESGRLTFVNQTSIANYGFTQEEIKKGVSVFDVIVPDDHEKILLNYQKIMNGEEIGLNEYTAKRKDGSTFPALVHSTIIYRDGKPAGLRGFLINISEKKNLEEQLMRAQKMEAIGTLAGGIAHDFNNLLMGILGNVSLMMMKGEEAHPFHDRLKSVEEYVQRGSDLTKQLLGFARGGKYEVKPTNIGEFIRRSSEMFGRTKKEIRIHRKVQDDLWTAEVDRGQMEQVLLNLFVNAWQAMPGGGDLYLSTENVELDDTEVSPYELKPGRYVKVSVTDTGTGMDEATMARVFEPFFTTKERGRGTGLGLASVYGIIKNHGGFIKVESEKGAGSTFSIYLPASEKTAEGEMKTGEQVSRGKETILLIDDEEMILDVGSQMLSSLGYSALTARGGSTGIDVYRENRENIDLVILDVIMPDLGGNETFERLRKIDQMVKVLLSSGYSLDGQAKEIMDKGCKGFIQKPFSMEDLSKRIRGILDEN